MKWRAINEAIPHARDNQEFWKQLVNFYKEGKLTLIEAAKNILQVIEGFNGACHAYLPDD